MLYTVQHLFTLHSIESATSLFCSMIRFLRSRRSVFSVHVLKTNKKRSLEKGAHNPGALAQDSQALLGHRKNVAVKRCNLSTKKKCLKKFKWPTCRCFTVTKARQKGFCFFFCWDIGHQYTFFLRCPDIRLCLIPGRW